MKKWPHRSLLPALLLGACVCPTAWTQDLTYEADPFRQLEEILPTPTEVRLASGKPGPKYWQQRADYVISVTLDDQRQRLRGEEVITYHNRSPHELNYLWVQLDQNRFRPDSDSMMAAAAPPMERLSYRALRSMLDRAAFEGGCDIKSVADGDDQPLDHTIVRTMMRVDLPEPLAPGQSTVLKIAWEHNIVDAKSQRARGGYEFFEEDGNYIYEIAQWFPRMAAYTDYTGWQNKQFLGSGEFTLEFGDYEVEITAPAGHIVSATGELQNPEEVLTEQQRERLAAARGSDDIHFIVTPEEAKANETRKPDEGTKTWRFSATNVRDFAWASSRKFIWDALAHDNQGDDVLCMSFYPNEAEPLWSKYSTRAIAHTLDVYSRYTFKYPYPTAISVNGPVYGMEYPMICFNGPRPEEDGTYSLRTKAGLISVIIHEVGHNYFPMIVNSDERQWTWMDEGVNTFLQFLAEAEWEEKYPSSRGQPRRITGYMASSRQVPIMTNSESLLQFGNNAYAKPATALVVLRETVLGRELFDFAFREYARQWEFKRPEPADLFRIMEDASGVDLDWFWRGWFYTTKHVDLGIKSLRLYEIDTRDPGVEKRIKKEERADEEGRDITSRRNADIEKLVERFPHLKDFYNDYDPLDVTKGERREYEKLLEGLEEEERDLLSLRKKFYVVDLQNVGGLVMPVILRVTFSDGGRETLRLPAEIWRQNPKAVSRLIITDQEIQTIELDPDLESADTDRQNNTWPPKPVESRFQLFKRDKPKNPMQRAIAEGRRDSEKDAKGGAASDGPSSDGPAGDGEE
ncbi:MAG: M1 family metallopeptidase [Planctomycetota bacterium]